MARTTSTRRESGTGGLYREHSAKRGCPPLEVVTGPDGKPHKVRPDHDCKALWAAVVELPGHGTERRRKVVRRKTRPAVEAAAKVARRDLARAGDLPTSSPTLATWLDQWVERRARDKLKPRTATTYRSYIANHLAPTLGRVRLEKLTPAHVERLHDVMLEGGASSTTALQAHRILAKALADALRAGHVTRNVATLVDAPTKAFAPRPALTAAQAQTLLLSVADDLQAAAHDAVALLGGLRQGERLGLTRDAIDLKRTAETADGETVPAPMLTVSWQLQRLAWQHGCAKVRPAGGWPCGRKRGGSCPSRHVHIPADQEATQVYGGLWLTRPKSRTGWREVPIAGPLAVVLDALLTNTKPGDAGLIFHTEAGHPIDPSRDSARWDAELRAAGLPDAPLHSARHTCSTLLYELGVDEQTRMAILGHSSAAVTRDYTHLAGQQQRDAMARLGELVENAVKPDDGEPVPQISPAGEALVSVE